MMYGLPLPPFPHPSGWLFDAPAQPNPAHILAELMVSVTALRAASSTAHTAPSSPLKAEMLQSLRSRALALVADLTAWRRALPASWSYETLPAASPPLLDLAAAEFWPSDLHLYPAPALAFHWGLFRILQLCALSVALRALHWQAHADAAAHRAAYRAAILDLVRRANAVVDAICASVPWHLGLRRPPPALAPYAPACHGDAAYTIYSWLFITMWVESVPAAQRAWMEGRLAEIARRGLPKAANAGRLERWSRGLLFAEGGAWEGWVEEARAAGDAALLEGLL